MPELRQGEDVFCILPSGNAFDFPEIDRRLKALGVKAQAATTKAGGRIYRIPADYIQRLPTDDGGHFLPCADDEGYSIYNSPDMEDYRKEIGASDWVDV